MDLDQGKEARLEIDVYFIQKEILGMGEILSERIFFKKEGKTRESDGYKQKEEEDNWR